MCCTRQLMGMVIGPGVGLPSRSRERGMSTSDTKQRQEENLLFLKWLQLNDLAITRNILLTELTLSSTCHPQDCHQPGDKTNSHNPQSRPNATQFLPFPMERWLASTSAMAESAPLCVLRAMYSIKSSPPALPLTSALQTGWTGKSPSSSLTAVQWRRLATWVSAPRGGRHATAIVWPVLQECTGVMLLSASSALRGHFQTILVAPLVPPVPWDT